MISRRWKHNHILLLLSVKDIRSGLMLVFSSFFFVEPKIEDVDRGGEIMGIDNFRSVVPQVCKNASCTLFITVLHVSDRYLFHST